MLVICNLCFRQKSQTTVLFLTNCRHVFCKNCLFQIDKKCFVCSKSFESIKIDSNMPKPVRDLFAPLDVELRKIQDIRRFQMEQIFYYTKRKVRVIPQISQIIKQRAETRTKINIIKEAMKKEQKLIQRLNDFEENLTPNAFLMTKRNTSVMNDSTEILRKMDIHKKRPKPGSGYH